MIGGDITEVTFNNPSVGSGFFKAKAGEGNSYDTGGIRTDDDDKSITGDGEPIWTQNRKMGHFQILIGNDMSIRKDLEKLALLAGSVDETTWTFTVINGTTYRCTGRPVGDLLADIDKSTIPLKVASPGIKQV
jgi:hypothetical protein